MKYLYKMGDTETYIYTDTVNELADDCGGILSLSQVKYAIQQLQKYGMKYWTIIDDFALLQYFMERENVSEAIVIEKTNKW